MAYQRDEQKQSAESATKYDNFMKWNHIMLKQPEHEEKIIECHVEGEGYYTLGIRKYFQTCSFDELLKYCLDHDIPNPDFWWISGEDFPFPDRKL